MKTRQVMYAIGLAAALGACGGDEDFVAPSFLHVDAMTLEMSAHDPISPEPGFYTSEITSCYVEAYFKGSGKVEQIGMFELPFTVPVLHDGEAEYLVFSPAVKISGISGTQTYYTFYSRDTVRNVSFRSGDTVRFDTLKVSYDIPRSGALLFEPFEPTEASLLLDSVTWHRHAPEEACSGEGYASVYVADTDMYVPFSINQTQTILTSPGSTLVYLELDHRSDVRFEVYMQSQYEYNSSTDVQRVMMVNPSEKWQHMYINLGRTWEWFNYYPTFQILFRALNTTGTGGYVRLDNVKVVTTTKTL